MDRLDKKGMQIYKTSDVARLLPHNRQLLMRGLFNHLKYEEDQVRILELNAGLSSAAKYIVKATGLFPYMVKIDKKDKIERELRGDQILRPRLPSVCISELSYCDVNDEEGILVYRYVTQGRVSEEPERLDKWVQNKTKHEILWVIDHLFESTLKKAHWQDGSTFTTTIEPPKLISAKTAVASAIFDRYHNFIKQVCDAGPLKCPVGVVHGDLHAKNIMVINDRQPLLVDFASAEKNSPIVIDYTRLDSYFPLSTIRYNQDQIGFPTNSDYSMAAYQSIVSRIYKSGNLILPRSARPVPSTIHEIRSSFWRGCLSKTGNMLPLEIDRVYSVFLSWNFARFLIKRLDSDGSIADPGVSLALSAFDALVT